jgi:hypothetical protein
MITARDLFEFTVSGFPMLMGLPAVTSWIVVINSGSEVDQMVSISGPNSAVITHGDVDKLVALIGEDSIPGSTLWSSLSNTLSVVCFAFGIDTYKLGVVTRIDLDQCSSSVVLDKGPSFLDVISVSLYGDITGLENPNIIFRIDSPDNSFFSRRDESLSSWDLFPRGTLEGSRLIVLNANSSIDFIKEINSPESTLTSVDVFPLSVDGLIVRCVLTLSGDIVGGVSIQ